MNALVLPAIAVILASCSINPDSGEGGPVMEVLGEINRYESPPSRAQGLAMLRQVLAENPKGVHERNGAGSSPLMYVICIDKRNLEQASILLEAGADPLADHQVRNPSTPLHDAARWDYLPFVKLMLKYVPEEKNDRILEDRRWKQSLLNCAPRGSATAKWLIANGYKDTWYGQPVESSPRQPSTPANRKSSPESLALEREIPGSPAGGDR